MHKSINYLFQYCIDKYYNCGINKSMSKESHVDIYQLQSLHRVICTTFLCFTIKH